MDIKQLHEKTLYPIVRIRTERAGGSGSIIMSKPTENGCDTFVLTNHHVVEDAITYKKAWDSVVKKELTKEFTEKVSVEVFEYVDLSTVDSSNAYRADIVAYDREHDLAILRLDSPRAVPYVSSLVPREAINRLKVYMPIVGCGCSLLHDPFPTFGQISYMKEIIDNKEYMMTSQNSVFGNSGGAVFLMETGDLIGVTSRVTGIQLGFGVDMMTWMGFSAHPERIYKFIDEQELRFLYDPTDTYQAALARRAEKRNKIQTEQKEGK